MKVLSILKFIKHVVGLLDKVSRDGIAIISGIDGYTYIMSIKAKRDALRIHLQKLLK